MEKRRNEDEKFIAAYGRDKTFDNGLEGALENCDEELFSWFVTSSAINKSKPQMVGGYSVVWRLQRGSKSDPARGYVAHFFAHDENSAAFSKKRGDAALLVQLVFLGKEARWRIRFPNEAKIALAYTKLVDHILKRRLKANAFCGA